MTLSHTHTDVTQAHAVVSVTATAHPSVWHEFQTENLINTGVLDISGTGRSETGMLDIGTHVLGVSDTDREVTQSV